jgi:hypothetical protein
MTLFSPYILSQNAFKREGYPNLVSQTLIVLSQFVWEIPHFTSPML